MQSKEKRLNHKDTVLKLAKKLQKKYPMLYREFGEKGIKQVLRNVLTKKKKIKITD